MIEKKSVSRWPSVGVVIPTHNRPRSLITAVESIEKQDYPGDISIAVVVDNGNLPFDKDKIAGERVTFINNVRKPGAAGARNSGILFLKNVDLIAFCDDDDFWIQGKLKAQVQLLLQHENCEFVATGIRLRCENKYQERTAGIDLIPYSILIKSRFVSLHTSTFLVRRDALISNDKIGLFSEDAPGSNNEDYDLLLRAARRSPIRVPNVIGVMVEWRQGSYFVNKYETKINSMIWLLARYPDLLKYNKSAAHRYGQLACWNAALRNRRTAILYAGKAILRYPFEPRIAIALIAVTGIFSINTISKILRRFGRGL